MGESDETQNLFRFLLLIWNVGDISFVRLIMLGGIEKCKITNNRGVLRFLLLVFRRSLDLNTPTYYALAGPLETQ